ncbi:serine/threonine-protein phosphatase 4 regulatory subunit 2-A-like isoform X2 [Myripristis murdjan]|nr:serine/threonine-protein phosphatase 4 regulatory subunit 2-A-like isoform X2 [Myripristis murdjan]
MFKMESVMDDFHASSPEQRGPHNPNVEYVPFEEMKKRILKIVDGYNGIPFTIQRLCELLTDPRRNYTGTDKFLRGVEKNVMVVSCVYPTSEKNGATSVNRMNGVMFPGNSSAYSDSRNVNGPGTPKPFNRPKLSLTSSLSTNGLPDCAISKEPESNTAEVGEHHISDSSSSEVESTPSSGIKNKHHEEDEEEDAEADKHDIKRLKFGEKEEDEKENEESSCSKGSESLPLTPESSNVACEDNKNGSSFDTPTTSGDHEPSSTQAETSEREEETSERAAALSVKSDSTMDQIEPPALPEKSTSSEVQDNEDSSSRVSSSNSNSSDEEGTHSNKPVTSPSNTADLSTEGTAENSESTETASESGGHE